MIADEGPTEAFVMWVALIVVPILFVAFCAAVIFIVVRLVINWRRYRRKR